MFKNKTSRYVNKQPTHMTLLDFLSGIKDNPVRIESASGRLLRGFGTPENIDTATDSRLSRVFSNRIITRYPAFSEFYGMEEAIERIAAYLRQAEQGLEENKQILYLLGPVGGGKSSIAETLKALMEKAPIYRLCVKNEDGTFTHSPVNDHPLCLFDNADFDLLESEYGIPKSTSKKHLISPWATKRLAELNGDVEQFYVEEVYPSINEQIAIAKTEPGDENNQDISTLVGKVDIRQLEYFEQNDADAYSYSAGALCKANQGVMEFVEMFKAPIKVLNPLLTATQERNFNPTEGMAALPFEGIILAHSNESEWSTFRNNKTNEAFLDRVYIVKVPYCLRIDEEVNIYKKLLSNSELHSATIAPQTLEILAQWSELTRLKDPSNSSIFSKMRVYNGENMKDIDPKAKSYQEYKDAAGQDEGMSGMSTRFAFKIISQVLNFDRTEVAANPVHLFYVLEQQILREQLPDDVTENYLEFLYGYLKPQYIKYIGKEIQTCYLNSYSEYGQNIFDRYVTYADFWIQDQEYRDPETGHIFDRQALNAELEKIEKPAGLSNPKDFRNEIVNFTLRAKANNEGKNPEWTENNKMKAAIEKKLFSNTEDILPVISFGSSTSKNDQKKHDGFVKRMMDKGYTKKQVRFVSEWYLHVRASN